MHSLYLSHQHSFTNIHSHLTTLAKPNSKQWCIAKIPQIIQDFLSLFLIKNRNSYNAAVLTIFKFVNYIQHILREPLIIVLILFMCVVIACSLYLPTDKTGCLSVQSGDITRQQLIENDELQANILRADETDAGTPEPSSPPETPSNSRGFKLRKVANNRRHSNNLVL